MSAVAPWGSVCACCVCVLHVCVCVSCNQATGVLRPPGLLPLPLQTAWSPSWQGISGSAAFVHSSIHPPIHSRSLHIIIHLFSRGLLTKRLGCEDLRIKYSLCPKGAPQLRAEACWGLGG